MNGDEREKCYYNSTLHNASYVLDLFKMESFISSLSISPFYFSSLSKYRMQKSPIGKRVRYTEYTHTNTPYINSISTTHKHIRRKITRCCCFVFPIQIQLTNFIILILFRLSCRFQCWLYMC